MTLRSLRVLCLLLPLLLPLHVLSQDFDLLDALGDKSLTPAPTKKQAAPAGGAGGGEFKLEDFFDVTTTTTKVPPKVLPKVPTGTKAPGHILVKNDSKIPHSVTGGQGNAIQTVDDFNLADALDPNNDIRDKDKDMGQGGGFSDRDLIDVSNDDTYKPDKGKGKGKGGSGYNDQINQYDDNRETTAEVGTIAGIASAVAMALVGAISSYISYQKKKLCFSIQQSLNADMVKAENPEGVVATEPQAQQTLLEPPNAEPRTEENVV